MFETELSIEFVSDWHIGSGLGNGAIADNILNRDSNGLPWIPGRAIKGALREGAWRLAKARPDLQPLVNCLWGTNSAGRESNRPGKIAVGAGLLPKDLRGWLLAQTEAERVRQVGDMTVIRTQTALDIRKMVKHGSLRAIECGIPGLSFTSTLQVHSSLPEAWTKSYFQAVCACVKSMGADRARGLGQCRVTLAGDAGEAVKLPAPCPVEIPDAKEGERH